MSGFHLILGIGGATVFGLLFLFVEQRRLSWASASIEAFRLWAFMAISVLTVWTAVRAEAPEVQIGIALVSPVFAALLVNNIYLALRQRFAQENAP